MSIPMQYIFSMWDVCNFLYLINPDINLSQIKRFIAKLIALQTSSEWSEINSSYLIRYCHVEKIFRQIEVPNEIYDFLCAKIFFYDIAIIPKL